MSDDTIPGWTNRPETFDEPGRLSGDYGAHFITRGALLQRSTLSDRQLTALVASGRLTAYKVPADQRQTMFKVSDIDALFTPAPAANVGGEV